MILNIRKHFARRDDFETNQQYIEFKVLVRGYVIITRLVPILIQINTKNIIKYWFIITFKCIVIARDIGMILCITYRFNNKEEKNFKYKIHKALKSNYPQVKLFATDKAIALE